MQIFSPGWLLFVQHTNALRNSEIPFIVLFSLFFVLLIAMNEKTVNPGAALAAAGAFSSGASQPDAVACSVHIRTAAAPVRVSDWCSKPTVPCYCAHLDRDCARCTWEAAAPEAACPGCWAEQHSRAATIVAALNKAQPEWHSNDVLILGLVGIDQEEAHTAGEFIERQLGGLVYFLLVHTRVSSLVVHAAGPCCVWPDSQQLFKCSIVSPELLEAGAISKHPAFVHIVGPHNTQQISAAPLPKALVPNDSQCSSTGSSGLRVDVYSCKTGWEEYDSTWRAAVQGRAKHGSCTSLLLLPNAGLWGYDSWLPAMDAMLMPAGQRQSLVITSYTQAEAEDDEDVVQGAARRVDVDLNMAWKPEISPVGCIHLADNKYKVVNNFAWQCVSV